VEKALRDARDALVRAEPQSDPRVAALVAEVELLLADAAPESGVDPRADAGTGVHTKPDDRDRFLAIVCHDLKDPLAAMLMGAAFLLRTTPQDAANARARRMIEAILRSGDRMNTLVKNLVDFSKVAGTGLDLELSEHDVAEILGPTTMDALRKAIGTREVTVEMGAVAEPARVVCDLDRVVQVLVQLVGNASRYAPKGSAVRVTTERADGFERITVSDSGPGMSRERLAHVFEPSWHARQSPRDGTGLGLAIVKGVIQSHGGTVTVKSEPGQGTQVSFTLRRV
jgi:signal transduction histidine kinase